MLYMVCHGSHQYTPVMLAYIYIPYMDPMGYTPTNITFGGVLTSQVFLASANASKWLVEAIAAFVGKQDETACHMRGPLQW